MVYPGNLTLQRANGVANEKQTFLINQTGVSGVGSGLLCQFNTTGTFKFNSSVTVTSMSNLGTYFQGSGAMTLGSAAQLVTQNTGTAILVSGGSIDVGIRSTTRRSFEAYDVAISALPTNQSNRIQLFGQKLNGVLKWWLMDAGGVTAPLLDGRLSTSSADPSTTEFPTSGQWGVHKNTSSGDVFVAVNDGGAIKKVALTS